MKMLDIKIVSDFRKDLHRRIPAIRLTKSWTSWIWYQYLSKTWNANFVICNKSLLKACKIFWPQETKKPRNEEPFKPFYFQVRESPPYLNMPTPTPAPDWAGPLHRYCIVSRIILRSLLPKQRFCKKRIQKSKRMCPEIIKLQISEQCHFRSAFLVVVSENMSRWCFEMNPTLTKTYGWNPEVLKTAVAKGWVRNAELGIGMLVGLSEGRVGGWEGFLQLNWIEQIHDFHSMFFGRY